MPGRLATCVSFIFLLALTGCGGAGSTDDSAPEDDAGLSGTAAIEAASADVVVRGTAVKGVLQSAVITAYELDDAGRRLAELARTRTDEDGRYSLTLSQTYNGGPVELELSPSDTTRMVCDASRCNTTPRFSSLSLPSNFTLSALIGETHTSQPVEISVTPWSTLAEGRARALVQSGDARELGDAITRSNAEVSQFLGFDITDVPAAGLSQLAQLGEDGALPAQYAVMNAAVAELVWAQGQGLLLEAPLQERFDAFYHLLDDGTLGDESDAYRLVDIAAAVRRVVRQTPDLEDAVDDALHNQLAQYDLAGEAGFTPGFNARLATAGSATRAEKIASFQTFMSQVRTWISAVEALGADQLLQAVSIDSETVQTIADGDVRSQFQFLGEVLDQVVSFVVNRPNLVSQRLRDGQAEPIAIRDADGVQVGEVRLRFLNDKGLRVAMEGEATGPHNSHFLPFELALSTGLQISHFRSPPDGLDTDDALTHLASQITRALGSQELALVGGIRDGSGRLILQIERLNLSLDLEPARFGGATRGNAFAQTAGRLTAPAREIAGGLLKSVSLEGEVAIRNQGARFAGGVELALSRAGSHNGKLSPILTRRFRLTGDFVSADGSDSFSTTLMVNTRSSTSADGFAWIGGADTFYVSGALDNMDAVLPTFGSAVEGILPGFTLEADLAGNTPSGTARFIGYDPRQLEQERERVQTCFAAIESELHEQLAADLSVRTDVVSRFHDLRESGDACHSVDLGLEHLEQPLDAAGLAQLQRSVHAAVAERFVGGEAPADFHVTDVFAYGSGRNGRGQFVAAVRIPHSPTSDVLLDQSITVSSRVDIPELRAAHAAITLRRSQRGEQERASIRANIRWRGGSYSFALNSFAPNSFAPSSSAVNTDNADSPGRVALRLFNAQGYELDMNASLAAGLRDLTGTATINGERVGSLLVRDDDMPLIVYPDGDEKVIESLL